jgi:hypothetical protein
MEFLQLWILPDTANLRPGNEQRQFTKADRTDRLLKVIGPEGVETFYNRARLQAGRARLTPAEFEDDLDAA